MHCYAICWLNTSGGIDKLQIVEIYIVSVWILIYLEAVVLNLLNFYRAAQGVPQHVREEDSPVPVWLDLPIGCPALALSASRYTNCSIMQHHAVSLNESCNIILISYSLVHGTCWVMGCFLCVLNDLSWSVRWCPKSWSRGHPPTFTSTSSQLERVCCCQILIHVPHRSCLKMFESLFEHAQFLGATAPFGSLSALRGVSPAWSPCHKWKLEKVWKSLKTFENVWKSLKKFGKVWKKMENHWMIQIYPNQFAVIQIWFHRLDTTDTTYLEGSGSSCASCVLCFWETPKGFNLNDMIFTFKHPAYVYYNFIIV